MKLEKLLKVRTPDGKDHDTVEAARRHMWDLTLDLLGKMTRADFFAAVAAANRQDAEIDETTREHREAIRDLYLATWPRAGKGEKRKAPPAALNVRPVTDAERGGERRADIYTVTEIPFAGGSAEPAGGDDK